MSDSGEIELSTDGRATLNRRARRRKIVRVDAQRAEIVLRAADGLNNCAIALAAGVTRQTVRTWRERFAKRRLSGLGDEPRSGASRKIGDGRMEEIVTKALEAKPAHATHWSPLSQTPVAFHSRHRLLLRVMTCLKRCW